MKSKVSEIDTTKVKETIAKARETATESFTQASTIGAAQQQETTQQARQLADRQTKNLAKVNAKSLFNANANFGVPLEALAFRGENGVACDDPSVPVALEIIISYFETSQPATSGSCP